MAKRQVTLAKNTLIFALGTLGSKLIQFFLVPFYTRILNSTEFGTVDLLQTIVQLMIPIIALSIYESVFRYAMEKHYDKQAVLTVGVLVCAAGVAFMCLLAPIAATFMPAVYVWLVIANAAVNAFWTIYSQYAKAIGRSTLFAIDNILMTFLVLILNLLFLGVFHWGINGYMLGYILANALATLFLMVFLREQSKLDIRKADKLLIREMLTFSLPLLLNGICWWISSFANRLMIASMVGLRENGIFAAANKIPSLLSIIVTIFFQAWQVSANEEFQKKDIADFYTRIHEQLYACIFMVSSLLIVFCKPITTIFLGVDYSEAWLYMPLLIVAMVFFSLSSFLASIYAASKETKMAFVTNLSSVVVNTVLNLILIPLMGMMGAVISTFFSYLVLWVVRIFDTAKIIRMKYHVFKLVSSCLIVILQTALICLEFPPIITYFGCAVGVLLLLIFYAKTLFSLFKFAVSLVFGILKRK